MYPKLNEAKSVNFERFKTLTLTLTQKMTTNDGKSYQRYLNKSVDHNTVIIVIIVSTQNLLMLIVLH